MSLRMTLGKSVLACIFIAGCGTSEESAYDTTATPYEGMNAGSKQDITGTKVAPIQRGNFFSPLENGAYHITIRKDKAGTNSDLRCILIKESVDVHKSYSGIDCDWESAKKPAPQTP